MYFILKWLPLRISHPLILCVTNVLLYNTFYYEISISKSTAVSDSYVENVAYNRVGVSDNYTISWSLRTIFSMVKFPYSTGLFNALNCIQDFLHCIPRHYRTANISLRICACVVWTECIHCNRFTYSLFCAIMERQLSVQ